MGFIVSVLKLIDRRLIFLITFLAAVLPMFFPLHLPIKPETAVVKIYDKMNSIPEGSTILMSFDYDPASKPECHPMAIATLRHAFEKKFKVVIVQLWPFGGSMALEALDEVKKEFVKEYGRTLEEGKDYVVIGYKAGGALVIQQAGENFNKAFQEDVNGRKLVDLPITKNIKSLADFKLILSFSAGDPGIKQWIMIAYSQYKVPVAGGVTGVTAPEISPFFSSGQLLGLMAGLKGAADYETLLNKEYPVFSKYINSATMGMESQNIVHLMIMIFIIIANIIYWYDKKHGIEK